MNQNDQTLALHAGHNTTKTEGTRAVPIYQTTSYVFDDTDHAANLFSLAEPGYIYTSCLLYTSPSPRDLSTSRMPSSA